MYGSVGLNRRYGKKTAMIAVIFMLLFGLMPQGFVKAADPPAKINIAAGKTYAAGTPADSGYPDTDGKELTDGTLGTDLYSDLAWQGWSGSGTFDFVIDLGQLESVTDINIRFLQDRDTGIGLPAQVDYSVSVDGDTFTKVGSVDNPAGEDLSKQIVKFELSGLENVTARFVMIEVKQTDGVWTFTNEAEVLQEATDIVDNEAPTVPENVVESGKTGNSVFLAWDASTDNVLVTGYRVYSGNTEVAFSAAPYVTVTGLAPVTAYTFTVKAQDKAGNLSEASESVTVTTSAAAARPAFSGTFLQPDLGDSWDEEGWDTEFTYMKSVGIDQLVLQWSADSRYKTAVYPTSVPGFTQNTEQDLLNLALSTGDEHEAEIYVGLIANEDWFAKYANDQVWLDQEEELVKAFATDIWNKYGSHESFTGWYLSFEVDNWNLPTATEWGRLANYYKDIIAHLKTLAPGKPVVISPFFNPSGGLNTTGWQEMWEYILNIAPIDVIALQDGVGAGGAKPESTARLPAWFAATKKAIGKARPATELWADSETFNLDFKSMGIKLMVDDMYAVQPYVSNYLSFSFNHYISPQQGHDLYFNTYKQYLETGIVDADAPTAPLDMTATALSASAVKLEWTASTDNIGIAGYLIYRDGEQVGKTYTSAATFTDIQLDASTAYQYKVQALDAAGNASEFSAEKTATTLAGTEYPVNLALGKTYTASVEAHANYPDDGGQLTDGIKAPTLFSDAAWQGYFASAPFEFVVDLGAVKPIHEISAGFLQDKPLYIFLPKKVEYLVSSDNVTFTSAGSVEKPAVGEATRAKDYKITDLSNTYGRYVKMKVTLLSSWTFIDEIEVRTKNVEQGGGYVIVTPPPGTLTVPAGGSGKVGLGDEIVVEIPAGAADREQRLTIRKVDAAAEDASRLLSPVFEVKNGLDGKLQKPATVTIGFDAKLLGKQQRAAVFRYDEEKKTWIEVGGTVQGDKAIVEVDAFGRLAVFAVDEAAPEVVTPTDTKGHWAEKAILEAVSSGLVRGYSDGTFRPDATVTRAEFAVLLARAVKLNGSGGGELPFTDREQIGKWAAEAVARVLEAGIVHGYGDGSFRPGAAIGRAEMFVMLARALKLSVDAGAGTAFADDADIPGWAKASVSAAAREGLALGDGGNRFAPMQGATRAEAVVLLLRVMEKASE